MYGCMHLLNTNTQVELSEVQAAQVEEILMAGRFSAASDILERDTMTIQVVDINMIRSVLFNLISMVRWRALVVEHYDDEKGFLFEKNQGKGFSSSNGDKEQCLILDES